MHRIAVAARRLGWEVSGLSRSPVPGSHAQHVPADLRSSDSLSRALAALRPTHVFFTAWSRQQTEVENIRVNGGMVRDLLATVGPNGSLRHVALVNGLKHDLGPFEAYGQGDVPDTPFLENADRLPVDNFSYAQEDALFAAAAAHGFTWSVHRSHTVIGHAVGNAMNLASTLAAYAGIQRSLGRPFVFPGSGAQWYGVVDLTDAGLLADQQLWAATTPAAADSAFNAVNGDVARPLTARAGAMPVTAAPDCGDTGPTLSLTGSSDDIHHQDRSSASRRRGVLPAALSGRSCAASPRGSARRPPRSARTPRRARRRPAR